MANKQLTFGPAYDPCVDEERINTQHLIIRNLMRDGKWRSLKTISQITGFPEASISAQLRHLRKPRFGGYTVEKKRSQPKGGTWLYQVSV